MWGLVYFLLLVIGAAGGALDQRGRQDPVGISGELVLDLVQEAVHRHGGQHFLGLLNGGQIDPGQAAVPDVVKADEGDVLRDADAVFLGGLQDAQGVGVGGGKDGGVLTLLCEELLGKLIAILDGGGGKGVVAVLGR